MKENPIRVLCIVLLAAFTANLVTNDCEAKRIHLLVIADSNDPDIGEAAAVDLDSVVSVFKMNVAKAELNIVTLENGLSQGRILSQIQNFNTRPGDAIAVYYSGHGAYGRNNDNHFLITENARNWTARAAIEQAIRNKGPDLGVVITDACFNFLDMTTQDARAGEPGPLLKTKPLFDRLFFRTKGFISVNSCSKNEMAACHLDKKLGSVFTSALMQVVMESSESTDVGWYEVLERTGDITSKTFESLFPSGETVKLAGRQYVNQKTQTPSKLIFDVKEQVQPDLMQIRTFKTREQSIDKETGLVTQWTVTHTLNLQTGKRTSEHGPRQKAGKAEIVLADNGDAFWSRGEMLVRAPKRYDGPPRQRFLGVTVKNALFKGVRIVNVVRGSPATRARDAQGNKWTLGVGDRILSIGNIETLNEKAFVKAVKKGPANAQITIWDNAAKKQRTLMVNLANNGQGGAGFGGAGFGGAGADAPNGQPNQLRFGATTVERGRLGVRITIVERGSPATKCRTEDGSEIFLEANDIITQINGRNIHTEDDYVRAVRNSPQEMKFTLLNSRDGQTMQLRTTLRF